MDWHRDVDRVSILKVVRKKVHCRRRQLDLQSVMPRPTSSASSGDAILDTLRDEARLASKRAYAPYSRFAVGAAVLMEENQVYSGCNVENASYGLSNCAERTAIFRAVSEGSRTLRCVAIYTPTGHATAPCGACRQVIREFGQNVRILSYCDSEEVLDTTIRKLLPHAFGPEALDSPT